MRKLLNILAQTSLNSVRLFTGTAHNVAQLTLEATTLTETAIVYAKDRTRRSLVPESPKNSLLVKKSFRETYQQIHDTSADIAQCFDGRLSFDDVFKKAFDSALTKQHPFHTEHHTDHKPMTSDIIIL